MRFLDRQQTVATEGVNTQARDRHLKRVTKSVYSNRTWEIDVEPGRET